MDKAKAIRWTAIGLHTIVFIFGVVIGALTTNFDVLGALAQARADSALEQALRLCALIVGGNLLGAILLLSRLFESFTGICFLLIYEVAFLVVSFTFLSLDYSVVLGVIVASLLYAAGLQRKRTTPAA